MKEINQINGQRPSQARNIALWMLQGLAEATGTLKPVSEETNSTREEAGDVNV